MRYEVLGPLRVVSERHEASPSAQKVEVLLAALVIRANQVVSADQLLTELWGETPPQRARAGLYVYISQLRKFLGRVTPRAGGDITTRSIGYLLHVPEGGTDVEAFHRGVREGRGLLQSGAPCKAVTAFENALSLWRGPTLGGLPGGPILSGFTTWLEEARLECHELLAEANLRLGRHRETVSELYSLTAEYPLRESFYQQLMLALYRSDRQADALRVYQRARNVVVSELGLEPCRALRDLHRAILAEDSALISIA